MEQVLENGLSQVMSEAGIVAVLLVCVIVYLYRENRDAKKTIEDLNKEYVAFISKMVEREENRTSLVVENIEKSTQVMGRVDRKLDGGH